MTPEQQAREDAETYPAPDEAMRDALARLFRGPGQQESGSNAA